MTPPPLPPKPPGKLSPLVPPRPSTPANKALAEHQREVLQRQSDHEIKVDDNVRAIIEYTKRRESTDLDVARTVVLLARELGVDAQLPESIRSLAPPPDLSTPSTPVHVNARRSARQSSQGTYLTVAVLVLQLLLEVSRHL